MSEKELTKDQSLDLILEMIGKAKRRAGGSGSFYFLLWGWVIALANAGHYVLAKFDLYEHPYIVWLLTIPAVAATIIYSVRVENRKTVSNHFDHVYMYLWLGVFISILIVLGFMTKINFMVNAIILMLAAVGTFSSGIMLRFRPLIVGAVVLWMGSILCFLSNQVDQYLIGTVGIFLGYIVPGYLLRLQEK